MSLRKNSWSATRILRPSPTITRTWRKDQKNLCTRILKCFCLSCSWESLLCCCLKADELKSWKVWKLKYKTQHAKRCVENTCLVHPFPAQYKMDCKNLSHLKQAVKRNYDRFPEDFMFKLTKIKWREVITKCDNIAAGIKYSSGLNGKL